MTKVATGSCTGHMASGPSDITAISACLPGARLPMRSPLPSIAAPRVVIQSNASAAGTVEVAGMPPLFVRSAALSRARCEASAMRATVNMSPLIADSRSTPTEGAEPSARRRPVMGWPWPCAISFSGVIEKLTPRSMKASS